MLLEWTDISPVVRHSNYLPVKVRSAWPNRRLMDCELILIINGKFEYITEDRNLPCMAGQLLVIKPGIFHTFRLARNEKSGFFSCIHCDLFPQRYWVSGKGHLEPDLQTLTTVSDFEHLRKMFESCAEVFQNRSRFSDQRASAIVKNIFLCMAEQWPQKIQSHRDFPNRFEQMLDYIHSQKDKNITRLDLAEKFNLSPEHINYIFRKKFDMTPTQFLHRERIAYAFDLIRRKGYTIQQAADATGFSDRYHFTKTFKKIMGYTPGKIMR